VFKKGKEGADFRCCWLSQAAAPEESEGTPERFRAKSGCRAMRNNFLSSEAEPRLPAKEKIRLKILFVRKLLRLDECPDLLGHFARSYRLGAEYLLHCFRPSREVYCVSAKCWFCHFIASLNGFWILIELLTMHF
jgi:hypothetical protein